MTLSEFANGWALWGSLIAIGLGIAAIFAWRIVAARAELAIQRKSRMLNAAERNFFECLAHALSDDYYIFTKVRVCDVVEPSPASTRVQTSGFKKRFANQTLDYVLCKKHDMSIFGVVELENFEKRSDAKDKDKRDKMVADVCKTANLRLFYFDIRQDYKGMDIRRLVTGRSRRSTNDISPTHQSQLTIDGASVSEFSKLRSCPKCHSEVVTKVAVKGNSIGEKFLMCRKHPYCDYKVSLSEAKILRMKQRDESKAAKPGFSDWSAG